MIGKFRQERDVPMQPDARTALEEQLDEGAKLWTQNPQRLREVMAEDGDIYKLSKILGHWTVAVTDAHYAHLLKRTSSARASK